jgi:hypothetical protein
VERVELTTQGLPSRIEATPQGPAVFLGDGQWELGTWAGEEPERARPLVAAPPSLDGAPVVVDVLPRSRFAVSWTSPDGSPTGSVVQLPRGMSSGPTFLARALPDGGALVVRNLSLPRYNSYAAIRFAADGSIEGVSLIRRTTLEQNARLSTVRFLPPGELLAVYANSRELRVDAYEVS